MGAGIATSRRELDALAVPSPSSASRAGGVGAAASAARSAARAAAAARGLRAERRRLGEHDRAGHVRGCARATERAWEARRRIDRRGRCQERRRVLVRIAEAFVAKMRARRDRGEGAGCAWFGEQDSAARNNVSSILCEMISKVDETHGSSLTLQRVDSMVVARARVSVGVRARRADGRRDGAMVASPRSRSLSASRDAPVAPGSPRGGGGCER